MVLPLATQSLERPVVLFLLGLLISTVTSLPVAQMSASSMPENIHHKRIYDTNLLMLNGLTGQDKDDLLVSAKQKRSVVHAKDDAKSQHEKRIYDTNVLMLNGLTGQDRDDERASVKHKRSTVDTKDSAKGQLDKRIYDTNLLMLNGLTGQDKDDLLVSAKNKRSTADAKNGTKSQLDKRIYDTNILMLNGLTGRDRDDERAAAKNKRSTGAEQDTVVTKNITQSQLDKRIYDTNILMLNGITGRDIDDERTSAKSKRSTGAEPGSVVAKNITRRQFSKRIYDTNLLMMNGLTGQDRDDERASAKSKRSTRTEEDAVPAKDITQSQFSKRIYDTNLLMMNGLTGQDRDDERASAKSKRSELPDDYAFLTTGKEEGTRKKSDMYNRGIITLVNSTPYLWRRGYCHSYQLRPWCEVFPMEILPGDTFRVESGWDRGSAFLTTEDSAGEVAYHLEGPSKPMSFMVKRRPFHEGVFVHLLEELYTVGNGKNSKIKLGVHGGLGIAEFGKHDAGSANFILAGTEDDFYSTNTPVRWMRDMLPEIKGLQLRQIVMPRSHYSGLYTTTKLFHAATTNDFQAQGMDIPAQLSVGGVRILDLHPTLWRGKIYDCHGHYRYNGSPTKNITWNGALGESLDWIIKAINDWQKHNPGELLILDVITDDAYYVTKDGTATRMKDEHRLDLFYQLMDLEHRMDVPDNGDLTQVKVEQFIGDGTPALLIRVDESWRSTLSFPGGKEGFVTSKNFPYIKRLPSYSHVEAEVEYLPTDKLFTNTRGERKNKLYVYEFALNLKFKTATLLRRSKRFWDALYIEIWEMVTSSSYPNWISMDGIRSSELRDMAVALNHCFAAKRCGGLGGRVRGMKDEIELK